MLVVLMVLGSIGDISIVKGEEVVEAFDIFPNDEILTNAHKTGSNYRQIDYIQGTGQYSFEYFIEDRDNKAWKILLEFNNEKDTVTDVKISAIQSTGEVNSVFRVRKFENDKWGDNNAYDTLPSSEQGKDKMGTVIEGAVPQFNKVLNTNRRQDSLGINDTEMYIELSDIKVLSGDEKNAENLVIKVKKDGEKVSFSTNGVKKGLITYFKLKFGENQTDTQYLFPGVSGLSVKPQHFVADGRGGITSEEVLPVETEEKINPGERPGLLISYDQIRRIVTSEDGTFSFKQDKEYSTILRLNNGTEMILEYKGDETAINYEIQGTNKHEVASKALEVVNNKVNIKLASSAVIDYLEDKNKDKKIKDTIISWEGLDGSQLLQDIEVAMTVKDIQEKIVDKGGNIAKYTYLKYDLGQTVDNKVYINLTPYKTSDKVEYYIFVDEKDNLIDTKKLGFDKNSVGATSIYQIKVAVNGNEEKMRIPIATKNKKYVRIVAVIEGTQYCYSQIMKIDTNELMQEPEIPINLKVSNIVVAPPKSEEISTIPSSVKVNLQWNAPTNLISSYLEKGELYYELILRDAEDSKEIPGKSSKAAYSKIYKVSADGKNLMIVGTDDVVGSNQNGIFTVRDVYLKRESSTKNWEQFVSADEQVIKTEDHWEDPDAKFYDYVKEVSTLEDKETGKVYYLSLRAVYKYKSDDINNSKLVTSLESSLVPLPIDFTKVPIPVVDAFKYGNTTEIFNEKGNVTGEIGFDHVDISEYYSIMVESAGLELVHKDDKKYSGKYEIYLYKKGVPVNIESVKDITKDLKDQTKVNLADYSTQLEENGIKWDYSIDNLSGEHKSDLDVGDKQVKDFDEIIKLDNLMPNQAYMIKIRVKLEPIDKDGTLQKERFSEFSKEFSFTTTTQITPPGIDERKPPTSSEIKVEPVEGSNTTVKVIWDKANFVKDNDMEVYYELIRSTKDIRQELSKAQLENTISHIVDNQSSAIGFTTIDIKGNLNQKPQYYMIYKNKKWSKIVSSNEVPDYKYDKIYADDQIDKYSFIDSDLAPNTVYYYYVRTVGVIKEGQDNAIVESYNQVKSDWIAANITTKTIAAPRNLKVERDAGYNNNDTKHNVAISFEAEVPFEANIPSDYDFKIAIKSDNDDDYDGDYSEVKRLKKEKSESTGWTKFIYRIEDLKSNTKYSIKVSMIDSKTGVESFYSEILLVRTDYDEEDEMDKQNYETYLKKWEAEVSKIKSRPYWKLNDIGTYKYRTDYMKADLTYGNVYLLSNDGQANDTQYYLPAEVIKYANENHTMLEIKLESINITIRANTLLDDQEDIKEALKSIQDGAIQDYYIVIKSVQSAADLKINGEKNLSPKFQFEMSLAYMTQKDKEIEASIIKQLESIAESKKSKFLSKLEKELNYEKLLDTDYLDELIQNSIDEIEDELSRKASQIINRGYKKIYTIDSVNQSVLISYPTNSPSGNAYYNQNGWIKVPCVSNGGEILLEIKTWGWYIITGMQDLLETVPALAPYQAFISQYSLTDIFKIDAYMIQTATTKQQIYGALAKVLGASSNTDYYTYLKNKGIKGLTKVNLSASIRQDEAIYLVMQGYEQLQRRSIQSINNSNKQSVQNIGAFQSVYRDYIYSAVTLKIVTPQNNKIYPSSQITVETTIKMLYDIQK